MLSIILLGCSTKTVTKIKPLQIPAKYLQCDDYEKFTPSHIAEKSARRGAYRLFAIELAEHNVALRDIIDKCRINLKSAKDYQNSMTSE